MKVELNIEQGTCTVTREDGDPKLYGAKNAAGESALLLGVKRALNEQGGDFIKKRMWKDGNLVDDMQQYVRSRKLKPGAICIYNPRWQIEGAEEEYNRTGRVTLAAHTLIDPVEVQS